MPVQVARRVASARPRAGRGRFGEMPVVLPELRFGVATGRSRSARVFRTGRGSDGRRRSFETAEAVRAIGRRADGRLCVIFGS